MILYMMLYFISVSGVLSVDLPGCSQADLLILNIQHCKYKGRELKQTNLFPPYGFPAPGRRKQYF